MLGYIYHITNKQNGKKYIGKTIDLEQRLEKHFSQLRHGSHHSHKLQRAFDKYGEDNFEITYQQIEFNDENELNLKEIQEIAQYDSYNKGYNETLGGDGNRSTLDFNTMIVVYYILQRYSGVNRQIAKHLNCDHTVIDNLKKNTIFAKLPAPEEEKIQQAIKEFGLQNNNLNENYIAHNEKKLNQPQVVEILSVIKTMSGYDKILCEIFNVHSKCLWRLKNNLIYKEDIVYFNSLSQEEVSKIRENVFQKYNLKNIKAKKQRKGVKNALTQEQVNYILDNQNNKSKAQIGRDLQVSVDRVNGVINRVTYKDLIEVYDTFHNK